MAIQEGLQLALSSRAQLSWVESDSLLAILATHFATMHNLEGLLIEDILSLLLLVGGGR